MLSVVPAEAATAAPVMRPWLAVAFNWVVGKFAIVNRGGNYKYSARVIDVWMCECNNESCRKLNIINNMWT